MKSRHALKRVVLILVALCCFSLGIYGQMMGTALAGTGNAYAAATGSIAALAINAGDSGRRAIDNDAGKGLAEEYDEILITLNIQRIGSLEIPGIIFNQNAYLPIKDIFDFLKIKVNTSPAYDSVYGFFIQPTATYLIDQSNHQIIYQGKVTELGAWAMIRTENNLYLRSDYFGTVFGLDCSFNFRSLSVTLTTKIELPVIREMQQEIMRHNLIKLKGEKNADTTIRSGFSWFRPGMVDWLVTRTKETDIVSNTRVNLGLGAIVAGGEANVYLNYNSSQKFTSRNQFYSWKYVDNDRTVIRQLTAGKIYAQSTSSIFAAIKGVQITNTPSTYRRSFGTYRLSSTTEPGWMVELYVNNVLVNYMTADASGFFNFDVPMVYGSSVIQLRYYGPWGEERTRDQNITIPFNFLPVRQLEYSLTAGIVDDYTNDKFSRAVLNYGLSRHITIGSGVEYLTSANAGKIMPFATSSWRIGSNLLLTGERMHGVRTKGLLNYRLPSNLQLDLNYVKYDAGQTAVKYNYLEEKKLTVSMPFRGRKFSAFSRITVNQFRTAYEKINSAEFLLSSVIAGISSNFTTYSVFTRHQQPFVYSSISMAFRFPKGLRITPQLQYEYRQKNFSMLKFEVEKSLKNRGFLNVAYERDMISQERYVTAGVRYNFSFAQTFFSARKRDNSKAIKSANSLSTMQSVRGSLIYDEHSGKMIADNQNNIGKGGLLFSAFLDLNCNGRHDAGESNIGGLKLRVNGGRTEQSKNDSIIRVLGLEAYTSYYVEIDKNSFDNVAWQIKHSTMSISIEPDHLRMIEVPVAVVGEVAGTVYLKNDKGQNGLGRIIVNIYNSDSVLVAKTLTEPDGYFSYLGLAPGTYRARVDTAQLEKLKMAADGFWTFDIEEGRDGDVADGLKIVLTENK